MDHEKIARLRERIAEAQGRERAVPLVMLGWEYLQAYSDAPSGSSLVLTHLEAGVTALDEGLLLLDVGDPVRAQAEATVGNYYASQGSSYWCEGDALEKAEVRLEAALSSGSLVPVMADHVRFHLARIHLSRFMAAYDGASEGADLKRARELLTTVAERNLTRGLGQDSRILLGALADPSRRSLEGIVEALRTSGDHVPLIGHAEFDPTVIGRHRPYSHTLVHRGSVPPEPFLPTPRPQAVVDVEQMRREARRLLAATDDARSTAERLRRAATKDDGSESPWLDRFLAVAATVVASAEPATSTDHLLLALGYLLRSRRDDAGWAPADDDFQAALASLLTALAANDRDLAGEHEVH